MDTDTIVTRVSWVDEEMAEASQRTTRRELGRNRGTRVATDEEILGDKTKQTKKPDGDTPNTENPDM